MAGNKFYLAIDQGTTSSRSIVYNENGESVAQAQFEIKQYYPASGWVEHDPQEIWETQLLSITQALKLAKISLKDISAIGISNQRETTVLWDKKTGEPVYNAIVWQDRRSANWCNQMREKYGDEFIQKKTGLLFDSYFSAGKIVWILENVPGAREKANAGQLLAGTIDSWIIYKLSQGQVHATDASNASRTLLYNINDQCWDEELLKLWGIPKSILPEVKASNAHFGDFELDGESAPIHGVLGDQQAALFGQACFEKGDIKNTYGTGCFMLKNIGSTPSLSSQRLLTTIAWNLGDGAVYALEGSVFIAGAVVQWLRDELSFIEDAAQSEKLALEANPLSEVVVVPAFTGLGAPHWDPSAKGAIFGLTRDSGRAELTKAALESVAFQSNDLLGLMEKDSGIKINSLKADGGACQNDFLLQFQANISNCEVERPINSESSAFGVAAMAAFGIGDWSLDDISKMRKIEKVFKPRLTFQQIERLQGRWHAAVNAVVQLKNYEDHT